MNANKAVEPANHTNCTNGEPFADPAILSMKSGFVGQTFLSAGSGDFPVARADTGLESPVNRQAGKPALHADFGPRFTCNSWRCLLSLHEPGSSGRESTPSGIRKRESRFTLAATKEGFLEAKLAPDHSPTGQAAPTETTTTHFLSILC